MKYTRIVAVPASTREILDKVTCDLCGERISSPHDGDFDEVTLSRKTGWRYVDGASSATTSFDCCGSCWESKIVPLFIQAGAKPSVSKCDY